MNASERVIRYRLLNLIAEGKLKAGEDFRQEDFKDNQHFVWKIRPVRFIEASGMRRDPTPLTTDNDVVNGPPPPVRRCKFIKRSKESDERFGGL